MDSVGYGKCVCFIGATRGSALRTLDGNYTNALCMTWYSMLQELAPSLEHQPSASAAWSLVLAQTGGINSTKPFSIFRALRNPSPSRNVRCTRERTPPSGRVKNGEIENVTRVPPRLLPQFSPRSPIPPMIVGRTISRAPARPGRGL